MIKLVLEKLENGGDLMLKPEQKIANAIKEAGMTIKAVSVKTGIPYSPLQPSLKGLREFRADEYLTLCAFFGVDPRIGRESA